MPWSIAAAPTTSLPEDLGAARSPDDRYCRLRDATFTLYALMHGGIPAGGEGLARRARRLFERLLSITNDVGLLAEKYDPVAGRMLGNFPQALSHIALVNTASNLAGGTGTTAHRAG